MKSGAEIAKSKADERNRKLRAIRAKQRFKLAVFIGAAVLVLLAAKVTYDSSLFNIKEIKITGTLHLNPRDVEKISGVKKGQSLLKISTGEVRERILKNSWVEEATVTRRLMTTLEIAITERKPFAIITSKNGLLYINDGGIAIDRVGDVRATALPRIADVIVDAKPGDTVQSEPLSNALACLKGLDPDIRSKIATLSGQSAEKLRVYTVDNIEILYGQAEEVEKKNQVIRAILAQKKGKLIFIDVRTVSNPIVKRVDIPSAQ